MTIEFKNGTYTAKNIWEQYLLDTHPANANRKSYKMIPILFSTPMVQAILDGRKTQTRRIIKPQPFESAFKAYPPGQEEFKNNKWAKTTEWKFSDEALQCPLVTYRKCPYGNVGDVLYVREGHYLLGIWEKNGVTKSKLQKWSFKATSGAVLFENNPPTLFEISRNKDYPEKPMWYKRNSLYMTKRDCRIFLKIKSVRVERLQDISEKDAISEGIEPVPSFESGAGISSKQMYRNYMKHGYTELTPVDSVHSLWQKINGNWEENPWVWVVTFEKI